ncbi:ABC transporter ATP-binding protein [Thiopseudomonas acetoxidans]|uniref:ABC transporter ATP-binding protein n=1 Tax=Thiopseudomonas acetoxidans TaxID=3041622 RepID=A0ABT7STD4_9GAMM|nr:ABC transporter ATP-binding protein [Thiopseudomonas sp. CY1220]MDM7858827.1 ABC transporter ATP-binding protein [Thiopseudomonas sp. CY1220]
MKSDLKKIWAVLAAREKRQAIGMIILVILMAFAETIGVVSIMPFLSVLARPDIVQDNAVLTWLYNRFAFNSNQEFITALGIASIVLVVGSSAFKTITLHLVNRFTFLLRHSISARLLSGYLHQPYEFFLRYNPSELSRNVLSEIDQLHNGLIKPISQLIAQGAVALAMMLLLLFYNPWIAISAALMIGLLYGAIYVLVRKRLGNTGQARQNANGERFQACNEALGGIKDVKITHAVEAYQQKFNQSSRDFSRHQANAETLSQSPLYMVETAGYTGLIILALILMKQSNDIGQVLPVLGLYGFAAYRLLPSAQIMYRGFAQLKFSSAALDTIHQHLSLPRQENHPASTALIPQQEIRLQGIRFAYPSAPDKAVLQDFELVIPANTSVGIIGKSGAGKSTVMDLLLGLLEPQAGTLSVDGQVIDSSNIQNWQAAIGYVPQHIYLADTSIAENIAFGVPAGQIDMQAVERAARAAQIHEFIVNELPDGYQSKVGDRGIRMSGGQRQRIGIARALYRDPPVLLMDEATSALDNDTEAALNQAVNALAGQKTIVIIAHREKTLSQLESIITIFNKCI